VTISDALHVYLFFDVKNKSVGVATTPIRAIQRLF